MMKCEYCQNHANTKNLRFCSQKCYLNSLIGLSDEERLGKDGAILKRLKILPKIVGENNSKWVGDKISYEGLHCWMRRHKIKSLVCEECKRDKPLDLANISGQYKRDVNDFKWLCRKCHMLSDGRMERLRAANLVYR